MEQKKPTYTPNDKVSTNLRKYLIASLASFEKNKEWADVGHWLQKVAKLLEDYPSPFIPEKVTFAKRLAQCLNPSLPHGVHMSTLHIYSLIFNNMKEGGVSWAEDLGIYSIGIFPFFQYASFQVKPSILELYQKYYFPLKRQLIPCIPGLVVSILPGLDEQNEELQKKVMATLDQACECAGKKYFIGALWMAILRTPKVRNAAIKYLSKRLKKHVIEEDDARAPDSDEEGEISMPEEKPIQAHEADIDPDSMIPDDPSIDVNNLRKGEVTLASKPGDDVIMTEEGNNSMISPQMLKNIENDLLSSEIDEPLDPDAIEIEYPNKSSLVLNSLIAGLEDENTLVQRITLDFLYSHFKLSGDLFTVQEKCILVEAALRLLIRKDLSITRRVYTWMFGPPDLENKYQVTEKNQEVLSYFIKATTTILEQTPKNSAQAALPLKVLQNFYMEHDHLVELTLKEIIVPLLTYIQKNSSSEESFREEVWKIGLRFMENIASYFATILSSLSSHLEANINSQNNEKCLEIINLIEFTFRLETSIKNKEDLTNYAEQRDYLISIISGILRAISSISSDQIFYSSFVFTAMSLTARLVESLDQVFDRLSYEKSDQSAFYKKFDEGLANFSAFFKTLVDVVINSPADSVSSRALTLINLSSLIAIKLPKYQIKQEVKELPDWVKSLFSCIQSDNSTIAIIGIEHLLRFVLIESQKRVEYARIKYLIETEGTKSKSNFIQITMEKLWNLLDQHYDQNKVCELLILFHAHYSEIFSEVVNSSFGVYSISEKEIAIRRFANFWKLAGEYHRNSPFLTSGIGLFNMLDSLENDNPLLRHTSKTWLSDSIPYLFRVLDPIFEVLLQMTSKRYLTEGKQYFYTKPYDTTRANDAFKKLKSILIVANELFIRYISVIKVSEKLKTLCRLNFDDKLQNLDKLTYLNLLVVLCLRYIQGQVIESLSLRFQTENASVNASACEFLELLIVQIENKEQSALTTRDIMEPLLIVMKNAIQNRDYVMQVQLINLLKVILFQSSYCRFEGTKAECVSMLSSQYFIPNLLKGLELEISYVRVQYINFISLCIGVLTDHLKHPVLTGLIQSVLKTYYDLIVAKQLDQSEEDDADYDKFQSEFFLEADGDKATAEKQIKMEGDQPELSKSQLNALSPNRQQSMHSSVPQMMPEKRGSKIYARDEIDPKRKMKDAFSLRHQNQNDISMLLEGVRKILQFFLKLKTQVESDVKTDKKDNTPGALEQMTDLITFRFLFRRDEEKKEISVSQFPETIEALMRDFFKILSIQLYCWRISKEFRQYASFTVEGITSYVFEKFNEANKKLHEVHTKIDANSNNVKSKILSVVKPLTYQYPTEIINTFISLWINECDKSDSNSNYMLQKQIEVLVAMNISVEMFINYLSKSLFVANLSTFYTKKGNTKKNVFTPSYEVALNESRVFFFMYTYIAYAYQNTADIRKEVLIGIWNAALRFVKLFVASKTPSSIIWLLEILYLLSVKYIPKELLSDARFKKELHETISALLLSCANICAKNAQIIFNDTTMNTQDKFRVVFPLPPTIFELYKQYCEENPNRDGVVYNSSEFSVEQMMFAGMEKDIMESTLYTRYRLFCFKTLQRVALSLIQNTYAADKIDRVAARSKEFMDIIFPIMENKTQENQPFIECASDLLERLVANTMLIKDFKKNILDIFSGNDFFKCSRKTLRHWSKIIDAVLTNDKGDLFAEFLTKAASFSILFNKDADTKQKIKSFERICFVIYSGERDKYQGKLVFLMEKMGEVIKNAESSPPALVILVLFCVRILILRLSSITLNELFRNIWPHLLTLLIQIFNQNNTQKNPNLVLAALKLVELMSIVGLEEFYGNQWVFIFDYFGLSIESNMKPIDYKQPQNNPESPVKSDVTPFSFVPYIGNCIPEDCRINYKESQQDYQKSYQKINRNILITQSKVDTELEIRSKAIVLCKYLMHTNEFRTEVNPESVELVMERDFITLDDFIFKLN